MVMRTTNRNYFEAMRVINSAATAEDIEISISERLDDSNEIKEFDRNLISRLNQSALNNRVAIDYFASRNISINSIREFELGFSEKQRMVTVPVHDQYGMCVGFVGRSIEGKSFKNSVGLPKKQTLFNLHRCKFKPIAVVESSFDVIRLHQLSIPAVATLGAIPSKAQIELLNKYATYITICPDKDDAGKKMVSKIRDSISSKGMSIIDVGDAKDIGDLSDDEIIKLWNKVDTVSFLTL